MSSDYAAAAMAGRTTTRADATRRDGVAVTLAVAEHTTEITAPLLADRKLRSVVALQTGWARTAAVATTPGAEVAVIDGLHVNDADAESEGWPASPRIEKGSTTTAACATRTGVARAVRTTTGDTEAAALVPAAADAVMVGLIDAAAEAKNVFQACAVMAGAIAAVQVAT